MHPSLSALGDSDPKPKNRQRASTPRSRTGCITCKFVTCCQSYIEAKVGRMRRLKCGEEKPGCMRCKKSGWNCDGYDQNPTSRLTAPSRAPSPRGSTYTPSTSLQLDEREQRYFQAFLQQKSTFIDDRDNDCAFWKQTILQECPSNPCVLHVVVALGALSLSQVSQTPWAVFYRVNSTQDVHHDFALIQYDKALRLLRASIDCVPNGKGTRSTLIAALTLSYFDCSCGNGGFAAKHIRFGRKLLTASRACPHDPMKRLVESLPVSNQSHNSANQTSERSQSAKKGTTIDHPSTCCGGALNQVQLAFDFPSTPKKDPTQPMRVPIDEYLVRIFLSLDINISMSLGIEHESNYDNTFTLTDPETILPTNFNDLEEARRSKVTMLAHGYHFYLGALKYRFVPMEQIPEDIKMLREHWLKRISSWNLAFDALLQMYSADPNMHPFARPEAARLQTITMLTWLTGTLHFPESAYDSLVPHFEYLVRTAEEVIEFERAHTNIPLNIETETYTFEVRIIPALYLVATKCRLNSLRRRAITLLLTSRRREGIWDSVLCGKVADWLNRLEEDAGMDWDGKGKAPQRWDGFVDEDRRVWGESIERDLQSRRAVVRCRQNIPLVEGGGWRELSSVIEW